MIAFEQEKPFCDTHLNIFRKSARGESNIRSRNGYIIYISIYHLSKAIARSFQKVFSNLKIEFRDPFVFVLGYEIGQYQNKTFLIYLLQSNVTPILDQADQNKEGQMVC